MALSAFDDKEKEPDALELAAVLGNARDLWDDLIDYLSEQYPPLIEQWGFSGKKWGWSLRVKQTKRTILYMTPSEDFFFIGFALGEKAVQAALESDLPETVVNIIENAPKYAEGRGIRFDVRTSADLKAVQQLASFKMSY